jgi:hypothetical protein
VRSASRYSSADVLLPQRRALQDLKDLPDHKARRTATEIGIGTGMLSRLDRTETGKIALRVPQVSIAIPSAVASETRLHGLDLLTRSPE